MARIRWFCYNNVPARRNFPKLSIPKGGFCVQLKGGTLTSQPLIVVLSYPGPEHSQFLQANLNGISLALSKIHPSAFSLEYENVIPEQTLVDRALEQIDKRGALAIIGPFDSETADLVIPKATRMGIPVLSTGASSPLLKNADLATTTCFRFGNSDFDNIDQLTHWLSMEHPGGTVLAVAEDRTSKARYGDDNFIVLKRLALQKSLCILPIRYERGKAVRAVNDCLAVIRQKNKRISSVVALGYTSDTLCLFRAL